jgi:hypothetical protein
MYHSCVRSRPVSNTRLAQHSPREWQLLKRLVLTMQYPRDNMLHLWQLIASNHRQEFPNLMQLAYIALTLPLHTSDCERTFSVQNNVVTKLRSRLSPSICDRLVRVKLEGEGLKSHDFTATVAHWRKSKNRILKSAN